MKKSELKATPRSELKARRSKPIPQGAKIVCFMPADGHVEGHGYRVSFVIEGEAGHCPTGTWPYHGTVDEQMPWFWGNDYEAACRMADEQNQRMGIDKDEASRIVTESIGLQIRERGSRSEEVRKTARKSRLAKAKRRTKKSRWAEGTES